MHSLKHLRSHAVRYVEVRDPVRSSVGERFHLMILIGTGNLGSELEVLPLVVRPTLPFFSHNVYMRIFAVIVTGATHPNGSKTRANIERNDRFVYCAIGSI